MSDAIRQAADRLIRESRLQDTEYDDSLENFEDDIATVARWALVAVEALNAARIPHLRVEGDPWFSCPDAWREDLGDSWNQTCFQCDGKPCTHGCNCGAKDHNAAIDAALSDPASSTAAGRVAATSEDG